MSNVKMHRWLRIAALTMIGAGVCGCYARPVEQPNRIPDTTAAEVLWLPSGATLRENASTPALVKFGRSISEDGSGSVVFTVDTDRETLSTSVVEHFAGTEWQPRWTQYLNPHLATSFERGWETRCACVRQFDAKGNPISPSHYHEWKGEWENARGDVVVYYLSAVDQQTHGYAAYIPRHIVHVSLRRLGRK